MRTKTPVFQSFSDHYRPAFWYCW